MFYYRRPNFRQRSKLRFYEVVRCRTLDEIRRAKREFARNINNDGGKGLNSITEEDTPPVKNCGRNSFVVPQIVVFCSVRKLKQLRFYEVLHR